MLCFLSLSAFPIYYCFTCIQCTFVTSQFDLFCFTEENNSSNNNRKLSDYRWQQSSHTILRIGLLGNIFHRVFTLITLSKMGSLLPLNFPPSVSEMYPIIAVHVHV